MRIEIEPEEAGRWIAEIPDFPGAMVYGESRAEAISAGEVLVLRAMADCLKHGGDVPQIGHVFTVSAA